MNEFQSSISEIKQRISECFKNECCEYNDLDFFIKHLNLLEKNFPDSVNSRKTLKNLNSIIENGYMKKNMYEKLFTFNKEMLNMEQQANESGTLVELEDIYKEFEALDNEDIEKDEKWLKKIGSFIFKLENNISSIKEIHPKIGTAIEGKLNVLHTIFNNENVDYEEIESKFKNIKNDIKNYFDENPNIKKVALGAGIIGMGIAGFILGKELVKGYRQSTNFEDENILTIAYYLSRYGHEKLFDQIIPFNRAIVIIAQWLSMKPNTLKNKRDYFDSITPESSRQGYDISVIPDKYKQIRSKFKDKGEAELSKTVILILKKARENQ